MTKKLIESVKSLQDDAKPKELFGRLGRPDASKIVEVPNRDSFVYVRLRESNSELIQAFNEKVSPSYDLPVKLERRGNTYYITGRDVEQYTDWGTFSPFLPRHGDTHSFNDLGGGGDVVWVYGKQFMPLLAMPSGTSGGPNVVINSYMLRNDTGWNYIAAQSSGNLTQYRPPSGAIMALVYLNRTTGVPGFVINSGTPMPGNITGTAGVTPYIPYLSNTSLMPIVAVRLVSGTTSLGWNNLYDVRQFIDYYTTGSAGGGGGASGTPGGTYSQLQFNNSGTFGGALIDYVEDLGSDTISFIAENSPSSDNGLFLRILGGDGVSAGDGGGVRLQGGVAPGGGGGGSARFVGGNSDSGPAGGAFLQGGESVSGLGGYIGLAPGIGGAGNGLVYIQDAVTGNKAYFNTTGIAQDWEYEFPNKSGIFALLSDITAGSGTTTPGGADTNVQYNDGGAFGGDANLTWDKVGHTLVIGVENDVNHLNSKDATTTNVAGGSLNIAGGLGDGTGAGGEVGLQGGFGGAGGGKGGDVYLLPGIGQGGGLDGVVRVGNPTSSLYEIFDMSLLSDNQTGTFPDKSGVFAMLDDLGGYQSTGTTIPNNGWVASPGTMTRLTSISGSFSGNLTGTFQKGTKLWWQQYGASKYGVVGGTSYIVGSNTTLVGLFGNSDFSIITGSVNSLMYSYIENPASWPGWFNVTAPTFDVTYFDNGSGGQPTTNISRFKVNGKECIYNWQGSGTKAATNAQVCVFSDTSSIPPINRTYTAGRFNEGYGFVHTTTDVTALMIHFTDNNIYLVVNNAITDNTSIGDAGFTLIYEI